MKRMRTATAAWLLASTLAVFATPSVTMAADTDVLTDLNEAGSWAKDAILEAQAKGLMQGSEGKFRPLDPITRREVAVVLSKLLKLDTPTGTTSSFTDLSSSDWGVAEVEAMYQAQVIRGDGQGKFRPNDLVTREEMAVILTRAAGQDATGYRTKLKVADFSSISEWALDSVGFVAEAGMMRGDGTHFYPKRTAQRQEIALLISRFAHPSIKPEEPSNETPTPPPTQTVPTPAPSTPAPPTKPQGSVQVTGKVVGEGGTQGLADAMVYLYSQDDGFRLETKTDENGEYQFSGIKKHGTYTLSAVPAANNKKFLPMNRYKPVSFTFSGSQVQMAPLVLPRVMARGLVLLPDGQPVRGAKVYVSSLNVSEYFSVDQLTDELGIYRLGELKFGEKYNVIVEVPEGMEFAAPKRSQITYNFFSGDFPEIKLVPVQLKGTVINPDGSIADTVNVELQANGFDTQYAHTDSKGVYRFGNLVPGVTYTVKVSRPWNDKRYVEALPTTVRYDGSLLQVDPVKLREPNVIGTVYKPLNQTERERAGGTNVLVTKVGVLGDVRTVYADEKGEFRCYLEDGTYQIIADATATGFAEGRQQIVVKDGVPNVQPDVVFATPLLQGLVKDKAGHPIRNAHINLFLPGEREFLKGYSSEITNDEGRYAMANLPDGTYIMRVTTPSSEKTFTIVIKDQKPQTLEDITL